MYEREFEDGRRSVRERLKRETNTLEKNKSDKKNRQKKFLNFCLFKNSEVDTTESNSFCCLPWKEKRVLKPVISITKTSKMGISSWEHISSILKMWTLTDKLGCFKENNKYTVLFLFLFLCTYIMSKSR